MCGSIDSTLFCQIADGILEIASVGRASQLSEHDARTLLQALGSQERVLATLRCVKNMMGSELTRRCC